ncbi:MAG: ATP-binding cassette domain-containing protein [Campylobacterales bacterium]|nr:ATP-binding cassette domain-containing protein [Campylobacterales bacterium]
MALLEATGLSHAFDYPLFSNLSFTLDPTQSMAIVGVSGCGKSTLMHICSTLLPPNSGEVFFEGAPLYGSLSRNALHVRREKLGIIFQSHYLFKGFTAKENIELSALLAQTPLDEALLERLGISHVLGQKIGELSGGQQQRVSIARVLSKKPRVIFADEPTGNLDKATAREVMDVLFEYIQTHDAALMLVTHDAALAQRCNHAYALENLTLVKQ